MYIYSQFFVFNARIPSIMIMKCMIGKEKVNKQQRKRGGFCYFQ